MKMSSSQTHPISPFVGREFVVWMGLAFVALMTGTSSAHAQVPEQELDVRVAELAEPIVAEGRSVGIAVGILDGDGRAHHYGFGRLSKAGNERPNEDTLFELGSITKCFTAILLADMCVRHEVDLRDPALRYLERGAQLPRLEGRPITLEELATYSSGLPRMPTNRGTTQREHAQYSAGQMLGFLGELAHRERGPGANRHYLYSNLGFALLGHCLAERAGEPIRPLILNRVARPMGMESTCFEPGPRLVARVARTYSKQGRPVPPWETGAIAPAGMLRSSTRDMIAFIAANVDRAETPLREAIHLAQQPRYHTGSDEKHPRDEKIGLAWFIDEATGFIQHDGATGGSSANVVFDPKTRIGVVVLMNQQGAPVVGLSMKLMRLVNGRFKAEYQPQAPRDEAEPAPPEPGLPGPADSP